MTIIRPNINQKKLQNLLLGFLGFLLIALVWLGIAMYAKVVDLRHEIGVLQKNIQEAELGSIGLQNQVYSLIDLQNLEEKANELGLVKERNPEYLKTEVAPVSLGQVSLSL